VESTELVLLKLEEILTLLRVDKTRLVQSTVRETEARILAEIEGEVITLGNGRGNDQTEDTDGERVSLTE
jgi:hypothetical protein